MRYQKYFLEGKTIFNFKVGKLIKGLFECFCICGSIRYMTGRDLNSGKYKSCGCKSNPYHDKYYETFILNFWKKTIKKENGCIDWIGNVNPEATINIST